MYLKNSRGFTLIELLVVVAIIGMLTTVVLASLSTAKNRGANSGVKSNLVNIRAQAQLVNSNNGGSYKTPTDICTGDINITRMLDAASQAGAGNTTSEVCNSFDAAWAVSVPLKLQEGSNTFWCIDSAGNAKGETSALVSGVTTVCP